VAYDETYIYFMVETKDDLSASSDAGWMRLLLDTDPTGISANWEGFEYILNSVSPSGTEAVIERSKGGWDFEHVGTAKFSASGKRLQIAVPRSAVGLTDLSRLSFNFKWADNTLDPETKTDSGDIMDYYLYGDVAPGGRFMFAFNGTAKARPVGSTATNPPATQAPASTKAPTTNEVPETMQPDESFSPDASPATDLEDDASKGLPGYVWGIIGGGAAVVIAAVIIIAVVLKKK
jgi:hypothetical protein